MFGNEIFRTLTERFPWLRAKDLSHKDIVPLNKVLDLIELYFEPAKAVVRQQRPEATEEEVHEQLVSDVTAYLKKEGVQMSGV